jgi:N-acetylglucosamine-6-phosphate deacetylase
VSTIVLLPDTVVLDEAIAAGVAVEVCDGVIARVGRADVGSDGVRRIAGTLLPGPIDLQCNGAGGRCVDEASADALDAIARAVWAGGAAAFLPTLITAPFASLVQRVAAVASWIERAPRDGARPLGIHVEGPFLEVAGTHASEHFLDPTRARVDALLDAARGHLRLVTLAPGRPGAADAIARLREAGVAVALSHAATADGVAACVAAGASLVTHLFNAMGTLHHRAPGLAGVALDEPRLSCSLIPDGVHVADVMVRNAYRCLGPERTILVTDSVAAAGMADGEYVFGGQVIRARGGVVRDAADRLAGSALTMRAAAQGFLRMVPQAGVWSLARVTAANPARILGCRELGRIAPGCRASFAVIDARGELQCLSLS